MIHVFHGFLGSPQDFSFLASTETKIHDLYQYRRPEIGRDDVLIGYSMGGRIAMELAVASEFRIRKLIVINAHPGLPASERTDRSLWEDGVLDRLEKLSVEDFLNYWNGLPLFRSDLPLTGVSEKKKDQSRALFEEHRLSKQRNFLPDLAQNREKVLWIAGSRDEKYSAIARALIEPSGIECVYLDGGHRLYQTPSLLLNTLRERKIV